MKTLIAVAPLALSFLAAPAYADPCNNQACLSQPFSVAGGPYVGEWIAHGERVVVSPDGSGTEVSNYGTVTFKMGSVSTDQPITAQGNITGAVGLNPAVGCRCNSSTAAGACCSAWPMVTSSSRSASRSAAARSTAPTAGREPRPAIENKLASWP